MKSLFFKISNDSNNSDSLPKCSIEGTSPENDFITRLGIYTYNDKKIRIDINVKSSDVFIKIAKILRKMNIEKIDLDFADRDKRIIYDFNNPNEIQLLLNLLKLSNMLDIVSISKISRELRIDDHISLKDRVIQFIKNNDQSNMDINLLPEELKQEVKNINFDEWHLPEISYSCKYF